MVRHMGSAVQSRKFAERHMDAGTNITRLSCTRAEMRAQSFQIEGSVTEDGSRLTASLSYVLGPPLEDMFDVRLLLRDNSAP
jgi:hypothetical protein